MLFCTCVYDIAIFYLQCLPLHPTGQVQTYSESVSSEQVPPLAQGAELQAFAATAISQNEAAYPTGQEQWKVGPPRRLLPSDGISTLQVPPFWHF